MAFVNEYISEEDIKEYDIADWDRRFMAGHYQPCWTRDAERDVYLKYVGTGRYEFVGRWIFYFGWKRNVMEVRLDVSGRETPDGGYERTYKLFHILTAYSEPLPESLLARYDEILRDLKEALIAFDDLGLPSRPRKITAFNFDFYSAVANIGDRRSLEE